MKRSRISVWLNTFNCGLLVFFVIMLFLSNNEGIIRLRIGVAYWSAIFFIFYFFGTGLAFTEKYIRGRFGYNMNACGYAIMISVIIMILPTSLAILWEVLFNPNYSIYEQFLLISPFYLCAFINIISGIIYKETKEPKETHVISRERLLKRGMPRFRK